MLLLAALFWFFPYAPWMVKIQAMKSWLAAINRDHEKSKVWVWPHVWWKREAYSAWSSMLLTESIHFSRQGESWEDTESCVWVRAQKLGFRIECCQKLSGYRSPSLVICGMALGLWRAVPVFCQGMTMCQSTDRGREWRRWLKWELWNLLLDNIDSWWSALGGFWEDWVLWYKSIFSLP